jgi:hypothetical protein
MINGLKEDSNEQMIDIIDFSINSKLGQEIQHRQILKKQTKIVEMKKLNKSN